jgi:hypothetical protein
LVKGEDSVGRAHLYGFLRHPKNNGGRLVLCKREGTRVPKREKTTSAIFAHPCQKTRSSFTAELFGERFEKHID